MAKSKKPEISDDILDTSQVSEDIAEISEEERLSQELLEKNEQLLRLAAEYENFRKRSQKEKESAFSDAKLMVVVELLPVLDNIDRAREIGDVTLEEYKKGIDMTFSQMDGILEKLCIESFGSPNDKFDPNQHSAVMHIKDENFDENVIADVFVKGYKMGEKILRPAMVKVAN